MAKQLYAVPQPTATLVGIDPKEPKRVLFVSSPNKHGGRPVLIGGRQRPDKTPLETVLEAAIRKAGGPGGQSIKVGRMRMIAVALDRTRDVREQSFSYVTEGFAPAHLADQQALFAYGDPDCIAVAAIYGTPAPNKSAATADGQVEDIERVEFIDVTKLEFTVDPEKSPLGAGHDVIVDLYRRHFLWQVRQNSPRWISQAVDDTGALPPVFGCVLIPDFHQYRLLHPNEFRR